MKIGITVDLKSGLFSNGVNQNAIYIANVMKKIGNETYLIHLKDDELEDVKGIKTVKLQDSFNIKFDLLIQVGFAMHQWIMDKYISKNNNAKLVAYECGNKLIMDMESMIFKPSDKFIVGDRAIPDQIWSVPQHESTSLDYFSFINKQEKISIIPFIWDPMLIEDLIEDTGKGTYTKRNIERIGVFEPNVSVIKNILLPIVSLEKYYADNKDLERVVLFSADMLVKNNTFIDLTHMMALAKDRKLHVNPRDTIVNSLNSLVDIVFSWQWENNLNYLWIDAAWMGWPVVHNGSLCQDIGYYYEGFNVSESVDQLKKAIESHNNDDEYIDRNRKIIKRYTHENPKLLEQYAKLVDDVINDRFTKYTYSWKTNSIA